MDAVSAAASLEVLCLFWRRRAGHRHTRRGWALALGLAYLASSRDDERMHALGRATIAAVLE